MEIKKTILFFISCLLVHLTIAQFKPNSIGVCYVDKETVDSVFLKIAIPVREIRKDSSYADSIPPILYTGEIILFDMDGEVYKTNAKVKFLLTFWCENDGGIQFRPTLFMKIKKSQLTRPLKAIYAIQNIACFVLLNKTDKKSEQPDFTVSKDIRLKGDYNKDGQIDCFIWTVQDDAGNCDGKPNNNLDITLQVGKESYALRCCGP